MDKISYEYFSRLDIRIGKIIEANRIEKARKLLLLKVDLGNGDIRQIVAGIAETYSPEELIGRKVVVLANIEPRKIFGYESQGMLLAADVDGKAYLLKVDKEDQVPVGAKVR
ncbi:MAG: methionine--tRNA ligase subunit beta [Crenarchaeota archaeon]|nr:methionine--tRNA ligase subunit beta [Thermoproteota archaeon]